MSPEKKTRQKEKGMDESDVQESFTDRRRTRLQLYLLRSNRLNKKRGKTGNKKTERNQSKDSVKKKEDQAGKLREKVRKMVRQRAAG